MSTRVAGSGKVRRKRRMVFLWKMFLLFSILIIFIAASFFAINSQKFSIQSVSVYGGNEVLNNEVKDYVQGILSESYYGFFSKGNILIYPKREIYRNILLGFPTVKSLSFELEPFKDQNLIINIDERVENGVWCKEDKCYFMDRTGYIFADAPTFSDGFVFSYRGVIIGNPIGQQFLSEGDISKISSFIQAIKNHPDLSILDPIGVEVEENDTKVSLSGGGKVLISNTYELQNAFDNLLISFLEKDINVSLLDYIDLRISDKVFYKHKVY